MEFVPSIQLIPLRAGIVTKNGTSAERILLLGDAGIGDERGPDIEKKNIASSTASESAMRGRQIVEEHGLKLF